RRVADEKNVAAIAGDVAAEIYGLNVLVPNIEDNPDNTTRFLIISKNTASPSGDDKTSLLVSTPNKPGSLHLLLKPFADNDVSMSRIESRPSRLANWEYVFFIDVNGHVDDEKVSRCLESVKSDASMFKVLGSYPKAVL
ncbi:MAG: ACT domain-containing protein, partial [Gammaproteobacteria bacterium]|nr:ACT domain-containing protein [Gammaproteobacteria bacterium]